MSGLLELGSRDGASLSEVLDALRDPTRRAILLRLSESEQGCSSFGDLGSKTALSYHFAILRKAGLTETRRAGVAKIISLRKAALEEAFPGLLEAVLTRTQREAIGIGRSHRNGC
jgi:DNA-binding transcriptional ArsR family regulator